MSTPLQVYQRVLQLPCDDLRSGLGIKADLDMHLKQLLASVFRPSDGFRVQYADDDNGQLKATISRGVHNIQLQGRYGQNTRFAGEKTSSFISYTIRAEGTLSTLNRAENTGDLIVTYGRLTGAAVAALMVLLVCKIKVHAVPIIIGALVGGQWLGGKVGQRIAQYLEIRAESHSIDTDELQCAEAVWEHFTNSVTGITSDYPAVK